MSYYNQHPIAKSILDFGPFVYQWELTDVLLLAADGTHLLWHEGIGPAEQYTWKTKLIFPVWLCQSTPKTPLWYINSSLFCVRGTNQDRHIMSDSFRAVFFIISNNKQQQEVKVACLIIILFHAGVLFLQQEGKQTLLLFTIITPLPILQDTYY